MGFINKGTSPNSGNKSAYQQNVSVSVPVANTDSNQKTLRNMLARINEISQKDKKRGNELGAILSQQMRDPGSVYYQKYMNPTNQAVGKLQSYGIDTSLLTDDWFSSNRDWESDLIYSGTTNTPSKPGKKATEGQILAYDLYQYRRAMKDTNSAKTEWVAMQEELSYWANRQDLNMSDDAIVGKVQNEMQKKYPTLYKMQNSSIADGNILELNEGTDFSEDAMYGTIWKARNQDYTGNMYGAMVNSVLGNGNTWKYNPEIAEKLNPESEQFNPYSLGSVGINDAGLYYNVPAFGENWLKEHQGDAYSDDKTRKDMYQKVWTAEKNTKAAEKAVTSLNAWIDKKLSGMEDFTRAKKKLDDALTTGSITINGEKVDLGILNKMDDSIGKEGNPGSGNLVSTTRAVNYKYDDVIKRIQEMCDKNKGKASSAKVLTDAIGSMISTVPKMSDATNSIVKAEQDNAADVIDHVGDILTNAEKKNFDKSQAPITIPVVTTEPKATPAVYKGENDTFVSNAARSAAETPAPGPVPQPAQTPEPTPAPGKTAAAEMKKEPEQANTNENTKAAGIVRRMAINKMVRNGIMKSPLEIASEAMTVKANKHLQVQMDTEVEVGGWESRADEKQRLEQEQKDIESKIGDKISAMGESYEDPVMLFDYNGEQLQASFRKETDGSFTLTGIQDDLRNNWADFETGETSLGFFDNYSEDQLLSRAKGMAAFLQEREKSIQANGGSVSLTEEEQEQYDKYKYNRARIQEIDDYQVQHYDEYIKQRNEREESERSLSLFRNTLIKNGGSDIEFQRADGVHQFLSAFDGHINDTPDAWNWLDAYQDMNTKPDIPNLGDAKAKDQAEIAEQAATIDTMLDNIRYVKDYIGKNGVKVPDEYMANLNRYENILNRNKKAYEYYQLTLKDDFVETARKAWEQAEFLIETDTSGRTRAMNKYIPATQEGEIMSDSEKMIFYYLHATQGMEAAMEYYQFLADPSTGVLGARTNLAAENLASDMVSSGPLGAVGATALAITLAPVDAISGGMWYLESLLTGKMAGKSTLMATQSFSSAAYQNTIQKIKEDMKAIGADDLTTEVATGLYSILYNHGRSAMNAAAFFGGGVKTPGWVPKWAAGSVTEFKGAVMMAMGAAAQSSAEAMNRGGSGTELAAGLIGLVTFFSEAGTEMIRMNRLNNVMSKVGSAGSWKNALAGMFPDMLSEMIGETLNEWSEQKIDELTMGDLSKHNMAVQNYMMSGMMPDEAKEQADMDDIRELIRTAITSFFTPVIDLVPFAGAKAAQTLAYHQEARTINREVAALTGRNDLKVTVKELRERDQELADRVMEAARKPVTVTDADTKEYLADREMLGEAEKTDDATKATNIITVLTADESDTGSDVAGAAYANSDDVLGDNPVSKLRNLLDAAHVAGVPAWQVKNGIHMAALSKNSAAWQVINSDECKNASAFKQARMLAEAGMTDLSNSQVQQDVAGAVHDNRVAEKTKELMATGKADAITAEHDAYMKKMRARAEAEASKARQQSVLDAKQKALDEAKKLLESDPANKSYQGAFNAALNELMSADAVLEEWNQSVSNAEQEETAAEESLNRAKEQKMSEIRQQAEQMVADEDAQREQQAAAEAQAKQQQEEAEARLQAEQDERTGKAWEDQRDTIVERLLDRDNLQGEEREKRREEYLKRADQIKYGKIDMTGLMNNTEGMLAVYAFGRKLGIEIKVTDKLPNGARAKYENGVVYLNQNLIKSGNMTVGQALVEASLHEITHAMQKTNAYKTYSKIVMKYLFNGEDAEAKLQAEREQKKAEYKKIGKELTDPEEIDQEIVADFARTHLNEREFVMRMLDNGLAGKMRNALHNVNQAIKNFRLTGEEREKAEYLRRAERTYQKALDQVAKTSVHPAGEQFSVAQIASSMNLGMTYDEDNVTITLPDGRIVDGVNVKITPDMIVQTPVGMLIDMGLTDEQQKDADGNPLEDEYGNPVTQKMAARKMFADLMNLCARYRDNNLIWEIAGSEFAETFSALKSNSDPQYKTTVDFGTICAKTQAIIDTLSGTMLQRIKDIEQWNKEHPDDQRVFTGLSREDIMMVYDKTHNAKLSVPCPVCYVFSRWMGVPSLLGQMNRFQHEYVVTAKDENGNTLYDENGDAVIDMEATKKRANDYIKSMLDKYGSKEKIADTKTSLNNKIKSREENLPKLQEARIALQQELKRVQDTLTKELEREELDKKERRKLESQLNRETKKIQKKLDTNQKNIDKNIRETDQFTEELREVEAFNWVTQALCKQHQEGNTRVNDLDENGDYVIDGEFRMTPEKILFDLNRTGEFAGYTKNWKYRTTRGAGMGKAIMPYSGASIGDIVNGNAKRWTSDQNPFAKMDRETAQKAFENAKERVRKQNLVGGQRFQSTSDFRPEWGLDYVLSFLEMQALGSKVQMYTKVIEAVDFLGSIGVDGNLSIMAQGNGYHEATAEEIEQASKEKWNGELRSRMITLDGKTYVMDFSSVTGIDYNQAKEKTKKYNNIQMILVGMNDIHIRLALANQDIDFVIPWHSSGNSKDVLQQLVHSVGEALEESADYTDFQTDQIKSHKEKIDGKEKTIDDRTDAEKALWDARVKLLTEGGDSLTKEERKILLSNEFTKQLYIRFTARKGEKGYDPDCSGLTLPKEQAEQIFPYEYWDKTSTRENADVNGQRFADYCDALGLVPRFSQFKNVPGYWKLLIDRKMYDNNVVDEDGNVVEYGKYRDQQVVDVTKASIGQLPTSTTAKYGTDYSDQTLSAIEDATGELRKKYDVTGSFSAYGDVTAADMGQMMHDAAQDYQDAVGRGDMEAAQEDVDFAAEAAMPESTIRDADGKLLVVYHGTSEKFTEFDMSKGRSTMDIQGAFFSPWELDASGYGENVGKYYLNITNPASVDLAYQALRRFQGQNEAGRKAKEYLISLGYDGVVDGTEDEAYEIIAFYPEQIKSADTVTYDDNGNAIPLEERFSTESRDVRYSAGGELTQSDMDRDLVESGVVTGQELAEANNLPGMPATDEGSAQRQFGHQTAQESDALHDEVREYLYTHSDYTPESNREQIDRAIEWVRGHATENDPDGYNEALREVTDPSFDYRSADGQARMLTVMGMAALRSENGDQRALDDELRIADAYNKQGTNIGRMLQARKIFRLMTPVGRRAALMGIENKINAEYEREGSNKRVHLSEILLLAAGEAKTEEDFKKVQDVAEQELADQMTANWKDKLRGFRMLSMLMNPRTHIRNILGNMLFVPAVGIKNKMGAIGEIVTRQKQRTKTFSPILSKEARAFARKDAEVQKDVLRGEAKYGEETKVRQKMNIFGTGKGILSRTAGKLLQVLSDFNSNALEGEDWLFLKGHYRRALGGWMMANGYTAEQLANDPALLAKGREYAIEEAQKATYRDFNALAQQFNQISRNGGPAGFVLDAILPFKKTPANILRRGIEYSPVGIAKSLTANLHHLKQYMDYQNGKLSALPEKAISPNQFIDNLCSGLTGTAIMAVGAILSHMGIVTCGMKEPEDEFEKLEGDQEYAITFHIGDQDISFTMDWAAPMSMPFFVGAAIEGEYEKEGDVDINALINAFGNITEPVFNLSMLDGVNTLFTTSQSEDTNTLTQIGAKVLSNYVTSYVPSVVGAVARSYDPVRRKSYVKSGEGSGVMGTFRYAYEQTQNKIPGWSQTNIPIRDAFGRQKESPTWKRILENFVLPGYVSFKEDDPVVNELGDLYEKTGNQSMVPSLPQKYFQAGGAKVTMDDKQYDQMTEERGQTAYKLIQGLMNNSYYQQVSPDDKAEMVEDAWTYATQNAKYNIDNKANVDSWVLNSRPDPVQGIVNKHKKKVDDEYKEGYKKEALKAVQNGDNTALQAAIAALENVGVSEKSVKTYVGNAYKADYIRAYQNGDTVTMNDIEMELEASDLGFDEDDYDKWIEEMGKQTNNNL